jgi:hypothetical protein
MKMPSIELSDFIKQLQSHSRNQTAGWSFRNFPSWCNIVIERDFNRLRNTFTPLKLCFLQISLAPVDQVFKLKRAEYTQKSLSSRKFTGEVILFSEKVGSTLGLVTCHESFRADGEGRGLLSSVHSNSLLHGRRITHIEFEILCNEFISKWYLGIANSLPFLG